MRLDGGRSRSPPVAAAIWLASTCALSPGGAPRPVSFRRSEEPGRGAPPADSFPSVGSYNPRLAGRRETEDRPARLPLSSLFARFDLRILLSGQWPLTASGHRAGMRGRVPDGRWRIGRSSTRPVLKHGPRSLTCARVIGCYET